MPVLNLLLEIFLSFQVSQANQVSRANQVRQASRTSPAMVKATADAPELGGVPISASNEMVKCYEVLAQNKILRLRESLYSLSDCGQLGIRLYLAYPHEKLSQAQAQRILATIKALAQHKVSGIINYPYKDLGSTLANIGLWARRSRLDLHLELDDAIGALLPSMVEVGTQIHYGEFGLVEWIHATRSFIEFLEFQFKTIGLEPQLDLWTLNLWSHSLAKVVKQIYSNLGVAKSEKLTDSLDIGLRGFKKNEIYTYNQLEFQILGPSHQMIDRPLGKYIPKASQGNSPEIEQVKPHRQTPSSETPSAKVNEPPGNLNDNQTRLIDEFSRILNFSFGSSAQRTYYERTYEAANHLRHFFSLYSKASSQERAEVLRTSVPSEAISKVHALFEFIPVSESPGYQISDWNFLVGPLIDQFGTPLEKSRSSDSTGTAPGPNPASFALFSMFFFGRYAVADWPREGHCLLAKDLYQDQPQLRPVFQQILGSTPALKIPSSDCIIQAVWGPRWHKDYLQARLNYLRQKLQELTAVIQPGKKKAELSCLWLNYLNVDPWSNPLDQILARNLFREGLISTGPNCEVARTIAEILQKGRYRTFAVNEGMTDWNPDIHRGSGELAFALNLQHIIKESVIDIIESSRLEHLFKLALDQGLFRVDDEKLVEMVLGSRPTGGLSLAFLNSILPRLSKQNMYKVLPKKWSDPEARRISKESLACDGLRNCFRSDLAISLALAKEKSPVFDQSHLAAALIASQSNRPSLREIGTGYLKAYYESLKEGAHQPKQPPTSSQTIYEGPLYRFYLSIKDARSWPFGNGYLVDPTSSSFSERLIAQLVVDLGLDEDEIRSELEKLNKLTFPLSLVEFTRSLTILTQGSSELKSAVHQSIEQGAHSEMIFINGGHSIESNMEWFEQMLLAFYYGPSRQRMTTLSGGGPTVPLLLSYRPPKQVGQWGANNPGENKESKTTGNSPIMDIGDHSALAYQTLSSRLNHQAATLENLRLAFQNLPKGTQSLSLVISGHGGEAGAALWDYEILDNRRYRGLLDSLPPETMVKVISFTCHSEVPFVDQRRAAPKPLENWHDFLDQNYPRNRCYLANSSKDELSWGGNFFLPRILDFDYQRTSWQDFFKVEKGVLSLKSFYQKFSDDKFPTPVLSSHNLVWDFLLSICDQPTTRPSELRLKAESLCHQYRNDPYLPDLEVHRRNMLTLEGFIRRWSIDLIRQKFPELWFRNKPTLIRLNQYLESPLPKVIEELGESALARHVKFVDDPKLYQDYLDQAHQRQKTWAELDLELRVLIHEAGQNPGYRDYFVDRAQELFLKEPQLLSSVSKSLKFNLEDFKTTSLQAIVWYRLSPEMQSIQKRRQAERLALTREARQIVGELVLQPQFEAIRDRLQNMEACETSPINR